MGRFSLPGAEGAGARRVETSLLSARRWPSLCLRPCPFQVQEAEARPQSRCVRRWPIASSAPRSAAQF